MTVAKNLFMPLAFAMTVMTGCGGCGSSNDKDPPKPVRPSQIIGDLTYIVVDKDVVGVVEEENKYAKFLYKGNPDDGYYARRTSLYFLREGAVITEFHAGGGDGNTSVQPRPVRQMLDFELEEFMAAKDFYTKNQSAIPQMLKADSVYTGLLKYDTAQAAQPGTLKARIDSLKGGQK